MLKLTIRGPMVSAKDDEKLDEDDGRSHLVPPNVPGCLHGEVEGRKGRPQRHLPREPGASAASQKPSLCHRGLFLLTTSRSSSS
jgi:hypothetical protein